MVPARDLRLSPSTATLSPYRIRRPSTTTAGLGRGGGGGQASGQPASLGTRHAGARPTVPAGQVTLGQPYLKPPGQ